MPRDSPAKAWLGLTAGIELWPDKPGVYHGQCLQSFGTGYAASGEVSMHRRNRLRVDKSRFAVQPCFMDSAVENLLSHVGPIMQKSNAPSPIDELDTVPDTSSPAYAGHHPLTRLFDRFASLVTRWAGSPAAFCLAVLTVVAWIVTGPIFHYSDGWQLVINTGTTIVTFLMVFLIQQSQNKDSVALHLKLNELLSSHRAADNYLIGIEDAAEDELRRLAGAYLRLSEKRSAGTSSQGNTRGPEADRSRAKS